MPEITLFIAECDGLVDTDSGPYAYEGRLTYEQIKVAAADIGGINSEHGYNQMAIKKTSRGYYVSYCSENDVKPEVTEEGESFYDCRGVGALALWVVFCDTLSAVQITKEEEKDAT